MNGIELGSSWLQSKHSTNSAISPSLHKAITRAMYTVQRQTDFKYSAKTGYLKNATLQKNSQSTMFGLKPGSAMAYDIIRKRGVRACALGRMSEGPANICRDEPQSYNPGDFHPTDEYRMTSTCRSDSEKKNKTKNASLPHHHNHQGGSRM